MLFLGQQISGRKAAIVNLDPANDAVPYEARPVDCCVLPCGLLRLAQAAVSVSELVSLEAVQREFGLGPNGGLVYCIEHLAANLDWLGEKLAPLLTSGTYILFDCPGQVELFNLHDSLRSVIAWLTDKLHIRCALRFVQPSRRSRPPKARSGAPR